MVEEILIKGKTKEEKYSALLPQLEALIEGESNFIANVANCIAALKHTFNFFWIGSYLVDGKDLVLGPFQGTVACTRIAFGKGVCGKSWEKKQTIIVDDVNQFPGHIACSADAKSEIVVPAFKDNEVTWVLDVDSNEFASFDEVDKKYLEQIVALLKI